MSFLKNIFGKTHLISEAKVEAVSIFQSHKDKIYPWVKVIFTDNDPRNNSQEIELKDGDSPIFKNWLGDLAIFYAVDMSDNFQLLLERDLPTDISKEQLHQIAVDNLTRDIEYKLHDTNFGGHGLIAGGNHEAGSICLPKMWIWLSKHLNDNLIVGIPTKDLVIMVPERDPDKTSNLKIFVHEIFKDGKRLLTKNIFKFNKDTKEWTIIDSVN